MCFQTRRVVRTQDFTVWRIFNHRKEKWCESDETYLNKLVISYEVNLFLAGLSYLEPLCSGLSCMPPLEYIVVVCSTEFAYSVGVVDGRHTMVDIVKFGLVQNILLPCGASRKSCFWYFNLLFSSFEHSSSRVHLLGQSLQRKGTPWKKCFHVSLVQK